MSNSSDKSAETDSYPPPRTIRKIQKGDKGYAFVKKAFSKTFGSTIMKFSDWVKKIENKNV
jgi:hypothetical protein